MPGLKVPPTGALQVELRSVNFLLNRVHYCSFSPLLVIGNQKVLGLKQHF